MSTISLKKDAKIDLTKTNPGLKKVHVGLGWDVSSGGDEFDLDVFAFVPRNGIFSKKLEDVLFYGNASSDKFKGFVLSDDNRDGKGDGDDEFIKVDFDAIDKDITAIIIGVSIYDAVDRKQTFGMVKSSYISIANDNDIANPLVRYDLQEDFGTNTMVILGKLYKHSEEWKFEALGDGLEANIEEAAKVY